MFTLCNRAATVSIRNNSEDWIDRVLMQRKQVEAVTEKWCVKQILLKPTKSICVCGKGDCVGTIKRGSH